MKIILSDFEWVIRTDVFDELLRSGQFEVNELSSGMEATVYKIQSKRLNDELVLKFWDKRVPGNVWNQYRLLEKLNEIGLPVSRPFALGRNINGEYGLITSYDGMPLPFEGIEIGHMKAIANLLVRVHKSNTFEFDRHIPKHDDFIRYFFHLTEEHADIDKLIQVILRGITVNTDCMIHGDFNLGNVLVGHGKYTIIDWTNAQLGDKRYDLAWASFLILIYNGDECYREFCEVYTNQIPIDSGDMYIFEMIACLRWIWLSRIAPIPIQKDTVSRVKRFINNHEELQGIAFLG